jgi:hypothetical protein
VDDFEQGAMVPLNTLGVVLRVGLSSRALVAYLAESEVSNLLYWCPFVLEREVNMRKMTVPLAFAATAALITVAVMSMTSNAVSVYGQARPASGYAEDRAAI